MSQLVTDNLTLAGQQAKAWVGRFAPSPTGPLHLGSLVAALGSYLIAKSQPAGLWRVRIEDLDLPRVVNGADQTILNTLTAFGFEWDGPLVYQSQRDNDYGDALQWLAAQQRVYFCDCSRKQVAARNQGIYDGWCRQRALEAGSDKAQRICFSGNYGEPFVCFEDQILGLCTIDAPQDRQDFVIRRRDGLFAYQLAVVVDDIAMGVNHVVRGADILDSTPRQNYLYHCFNLTAPSYYHLPLVVDAQGEKLSKRKFSAAIKAEQASYWLIKALIHLGQKIEPDYSQLMPAEILKRACQHWQLDKVGTQAQQIVD